MISIREIKSLRFLPKVVYWAKWPFCAFLCLASLKIQGQSRSLETELTAPVESELPNQLELSSPTEIVDLSSWSGFKSYLQAVESILQLAGRSVVYDYLTDEQKSQLMATTTYQFAKPILWPEALRQVLAPLSLSYFADELDPLGAVYIMSEGMSKDMQREQADRRLALNNKKIDVNFSAGQRIDKAIEEIADLAGIQLNMDYIKNELINAQTSTVPQRTTFRTAPGQPMEWRDALGNVLAPFGYDFIEKNGAVVPMSKENATSERANAEAARPLVREVVRIRHASVKDLISRIAAMKIHSERGASIASLEEDPDTTASLASEGFRRPRIIPSIVVTDTKDKADEIVAMIKRLDVVERQVLIEVRILELVNNDDERVGFNWDSLGIFAGGVNAVSEWGENVDKARGESSTTATRKSSITPGGFVAGQTERTYGNNRDIGVERTYNAARSAILGPLDVSFVMDALRQQGNTKLLSHPVVVIGNRSDATITIGQDFPYLITTVDRNATNNAVTYEWQTLSIGISLWVQPEITPDNSQIRLSIHPNISDLAGEKSSPAGDTYPVVSRREVFTRVNVPDGDTLLLGGLMGTRNIEQTSKVPLLGDIPFLGRLFRHNENANEISNLIFLITPSILDEAEPNSGFEYMSMSAVTNLTATIQRVEPARESYSFPLSEPEDDSLFKGLKPGEGTKSP